METKLAERQMENLDLYETKNLSDDEIIKLRVKGALESLKNKVLDGEGKELQEKNVLVKEVKGEEITKIVWVKYVNYQAFININKFSSSFLFL